MTETINIAKGLSFHFDTIHGYVTGTVHSGIDDIHVFGRAAEKGAPEGTAYRMVHIRVGAVSSESVHYGQVRVVSSWEWITEADFDRIVNMSEIRESLGWVA